MTALDDAIMKDFRLAQARSRFVKLVTSELDRAYAKHGDEPWSRHEFYAILLEEVDELWDDIKADKPLDLVMKELVQVAAMCLRYAETGEMADMLRDFEAIERGG